MNNLKKEIIIAINNKEDCERLDKSLGTNFKSTEEHIDEAIDTFIKMIEECGNEGGWFIGDGIKINIEMEYEPEDK